MGNGFANVLSSEVAECGARDAKRGEKTVMGKTQSSWSLYVGERQTESPHASRRAAMRFAPREQTCRFREGANSHAVTTDCGANRLVVLQFAFLLSCFDFAVFQLLTTRAGKLLIVFDAQWFTLQFAPLAAWVRCRESAHGLTVACSDTVQVNSIRCTHEVQNTQYTCNDYTSCVHWMCPQTCSPPTAANRKPANSPRRRKTWVRSPCITHHSSSSYCNVHGVVMVLVVSTVPVV